MCFFFCSCLRLAESLLAMCGTAKRDAQLDGLLDSVILPAVRHAAPHVRAPAVRALGLFCLQGWPEAGIFFKMLFFDSHTLVKYCF